jgi:uncharacterized repeat protein (TIGR01451 family)
METTPTPPRSILYRVLLIAVLTCLSTAKSGLTSSPISTPGLKISPGTSMLMHGLNENTGGNCGTCDVINGPAGPVCPGSQNTFTAQITGACDNPVYTWTVTGNSAGIVANGSSVTVTAGNLCNQSFTISVSIACEGCSPSPISCSATVLVEDITAPTITFCPPNLTVDCNVSTLPGNTGNATATDLCDPTITILHFDYFETPPSPSPEMRLVYLPPGSMTGSCVSASDCQSGTICFGLEYTPGVSGILTSYTTGFFVDCYNGSTPILSNSSCVMNDMSGEIDDCSGSGLVLMNSSGNTGSIPIFINVPVILHQICFQLGMGGTILLDEDEATDLTTSVELSGGGLVTELPSFTNFLVQFDSYCNQTCPYPINIYRRFVAMDDCGNEGTCIQNITIKDLSAPTFTCPANVTVQCNTSTDVSVTGTATVTDNCDNSPTVTFSEVTVSGTCPQEMTITRTWTAEDNCGNISTCIQTVFVDDSTPPLVTCPPNVTIECNQSTSTANTGNATATDLCDGLAVISHVDYLGTPPGQSPEMRLVYLPPGAITGSCSSATNCQNGTICFGLQYTPGLTGTLTSYTTGFFINCYNGSSPIVYNSSCVMNDMSGAIEDCSGSGLVLMNSSGNSGAIPVVKNVPVMLHQICFHLGAGGSILVDEDEATDLTTSLDLPGGSLATETPSFTNFLVNFDTYCNVTCPYPYIIYREFIAEDDCGNDGTCVQLITIQDKTAPIITCPPNVTVQCNTSTTPATTGIATATDNCDISVIPTFTDVTVGGACPQELTINRTWTATDDCGNSSSCTQTIFVDDSTPPVITCPANVTVQCNTSTAPAVTGSATATDNCDISVIPTFTDVTVGGACPQKLTITRTWKATDDCGNSSTCAQIIFVDDSTPPTITFCPPNVTVQCSSLTAPALTGSATATDICDASVIPTFSDVTVAGSCPQKFTITRTWRATDDCGNSSTCLQTITVNDNTPPSITCPANVTVSCIGQVPAININTVMTSDNCGGAVTVTFVSDNISGTVCANRLTLTRIYRATDACGNSATCSQIITVNDQTPPTITCPAPLNVTCASQVPAPDITSVIKSDNCGGTPVITFVSDVTTNQTCVNRYTLTRTYRATDACGNSATCTQTITVNDQTAPTITCPVSITVSCANMVPAPNPGGIVASDNCNGAPTVTFVSDVTTNQTCVNKYTITRTYRATDECNNSTTCAQTITVNDLTPPTITCPAPITVTCASLVPPANTMSLTSSDNCGGNVTIASLGDVVSNMSCANRFTITRTYRATDACLNTATCTQIITVFDGTPPSITCPGDITVQCFAQVPVPAPGSVSASDNCNSAPVVTFVNDVTTNQTCINRLTITRTYRATDECGNSSTCAQIITVFDNTLPTITCPANTTVNCASLVPVPSPGTISASDNCNGIPVVTFVNDVTTNQTCVNRYTITRTYRATDECGNSSTCSHTITVNDQTPPTITCPAPVTVSCANMVPAPSPGNVSASDNCNGSPTVTFVSDVTVGQTCVNRYLLTRTYRATDECGNSATCTQIITVNDQNPPSITCPGNVTVSCAGMVPAPNIGSVTASDNCSGIPVVTFVNDVTTNQTCTNRYTIARTYRAVDECGNSSTCSQIILVNDQTSPTITCPLNVSVTCASDVPPVNINSVSASDNCQGTVTITHLGDVISNQTCANQYTLTRTYRAMDECGNSSSCSQLIFVNDQTPPTITCPPDVSVTCTELIPVPNPMSITASDNCNGQVTVTFVQDVNSNQVCANRYTVNRTYRAMDECGNSTTCTQLIFVNDQTPPSIACPPNLTVACAIEVPGVNTEGISTTDNCDGSVNVVHLGDVVSNQSCANRYTLTRTYRAIDACGNSTSCSQIITVFDNIPPAIDCPNDVTVDVESSTLPGNTGMATASDNCGDTPQISYSDVTVVGACTTDYFIHRTWRAIDLCGNSSTCLQEVTIQGGCVVDLSLTKSLAIGQTMNIIPGDNINFVIRVTNNGNVTIGSVSVVDYIPLGFSLNDSDWTAGTYGSTGQSGSILLSIGNGLLPMGGLLPNAYVEVEITLKSDDHLSGGSYTNTAEISAVFALDGGDISDSDIDSHPDTNDTNDPANEDDHDPLVFCVQIDPVILGDRIACRRDTSVYTVESYNPDHTYNWIVGPGGFVIHQTNSSITVLWDAPPGTVITIVLQESAGEDCQFSTAIDVTMGGGEAIACFDHINLSISDDCGTKILSGMILTGDQHGDDSYQVFVIDMTTGDTLPNATVDWTDVGKTFKVSIRSRCSGQSCWGLVTIEDKSPPIINCFCSRPIEGERCRISCIEVDQILNGNIPGGIRPLIVDDCGGATLEVSNVDLHFADCSNGYVNISWLATDAFGNTATCEQSFDIIPLNLNDLVWPADYTGDCDDSSDPDYTGWPKLEGLNLSDVVQSCNIWTQHDDQVIPICGHGRKIIRRWKVTNMCNAQSAVFIQTILLKDRVGPVLTCSPNITVSTDVWACYTNVNMPKPGAVDACSAVKTYQLFSTGGTVVEIGGQFTITSLPVGIHQAKWIVTDECYNSSTCIVQITVKDNVPPVVSCQAHTVVSLTNDRSNGITLVPASSFDDGSFDNCSQVLFRARRMDSCIDFNWTTNGACVDDTPGGNPPVDDLDRGTAYGTCIPVGCCDIGSPFMVQLEVSDQAGNVNYCMVEVEVQDKLKPVVTCPPTIAISCDYLLEVHPGTYSDATGNGNGNLDEDPLSALFGNVYDAFHYKQSDRKHIIINDEGNDQYQQPHDWGIEGWAADNCEVDLSVAVSVIDDCTGSSFPGDHPAGAVKLIERRFIANDGVQSGTCLQRIWVIDYHRFFITDTTCNNENPADGIIWPCDVLVTNCPQEITNTGEPVILDDGCSLIGVSHEDTRFDFAEGACFKILREWKIIDWCQFNANTGYGLWTYTQTIKVADNEGAAFLDCPSGPIALCLSDPGISLPANNQLFIGENNPDASSCSVNVIMQQTVKEMCSTSVTYDVKIYPFNGQDFIQVKPETTIELDTNHEAILYFNTQESGIPDIVLNGLPYNSPLCGDYHRVLWSVEDGCGNRTYCDYLFRLEDCKKPTPVCIDGLSTVVMPPSGEVTLFAKDFNASSVDDCTPSDQLVFSFSGGVFEPSFTFTCDNVPVFGVPFDIEMWAADGGSDVNCNGTIEWSERNKDFCTASLVITDNNNVCDQGGLVLAGEIMTDQVQAVSNVMVQLNGPQNNTPTFMTHDDGKYTFAGVKTGFDYDIRPERNDDPKNGVSTLDLVEIQKHLLGKEPFTKASQYIAADANNSGSVSAIDLIEIRKLILGLYDKFPNNQSWRFVRKEEAENPGAPWPLTESISIHSLEPNENKNFDFVGVKIGDVNSTAKAHLTQIMPRNARPLIGVNAVVNGEIKKGAMVEYKFIIPEVIDGFQWTLESNGLEYVGIKSTSIPIDDSHVGLLDHGVITMSWNGEPVSNTDQENMSFIIQFRVTGEGKPKEMLKMTNAVTPAEAYSSNGEILDVKLDFDEDRSFTDFALYQNKPNPWDGQTLIEFDLPDDGTATLTIYDVAGKVVKTIESLYKAGHNSVMLTARDIPTPGVLYYRLDSGPYTAVKKMMIFH